MDFENSGLSQYCTFPRPRDPGDGCQAAGREHEHVKKYDPAPLAQRVVRHAPDQVHDVRRSEEVHEGALGDEPALITHACMLTATSIPMPAHASTQCWDRTGVPLDAHHSQAVPGVPLDAHHSQAVTGVPLDAREAAPDHEIAAGGHQADEGVDLLQLQLGLQTQTTALSSS